jgi:antitoxin VapB
VRACPELAKGNLLFLCLKTPLPWHILLYMPIQHRKARLFMNNRSQAVRLPKDFQFKTDEVYIRKEGEELVLSPRPSDWSSYLADAPVASASFMEGIEDLPIQERKS